MGEETWEIIATGKIGDLDSRLHQVSAQILLAKVGWEAGPIQQSPPVALANVSAGSLPVMVPHSKWREGTIVPEGVLSTVQSGTVSWHPAQERAAALTRCRTTSAMAGPASAGAAKPISMPAHPIGALAGLPLFRVSIDGREAFVPVMEVMRVLFLQDTFWAKHMLELNWQREEDPQKGFDAVERMPFPDEAIVRVQARISFKTASVEPFRWLCDAAAKDAYFRLGGHLQSDRYLQEPAFVRTSFPLGEPTVWRFNSSFVAFNKEENSPPVVVELVTRIHSVTSERAPQVLHLHVPSSKGSTSSRRRLDPALTGLGEEGIRVEQDRYGSTRKATAFFENPNAAPEDLELVRILDTTVAREATRALRVDDDVPPTGGSTAERSGSSPEVAQVSFGGFGEHHESQTASSCVLAEAIKMAGDDLGMKFEEVRSTEPHGLWVFPRVHEGRRLSWSIMRVAEDRRPVPRLLRVYCLSDELRRGYFFASLVSSYEAAIGGYERAIGLLTMPCSAALDQRQIREIAQNIALARGTFRYIEPNLGNTLIRMSKVRHQAGRSKQKFEIKRAFCLQNTV